MRAKKFLDSSLLFYFFNIIYLNYILVAFVLQHLHPTEHIKRRK